MNLAGTKQKRMKNKSRQLVRAELLASRAARNQVVARSNPNASVRDAARNAYLAASDKRDALKAARRRKQDADFNVFLTALKNAPLAQTQPRLSYAS
jgi:hypothetical protein